MKAFGGTGAGPLAGGSAEFLEKTARSIAEVQPSLDTVPEVVVFLEVLGYTNATAVKNGFRDLFDVADHLYPVLDHYVDREETMRDQQESMLLPVPSVGRRLARGVGLVFPWLGSLMVLLFFGVSLWLVFGLPLFFTTSLIVGLFLGLLASEGPVQLFQRIFSFYLDQYNLSEVRRAIGRSYYLALLMLGCIVAAIFWVCLLAHIPQDLMILATLASSTILLHRVSYTLVYSLKRFGQIVASYAAALATLVLVYTWMGGLIPLEIQRYLVSLGTAVVVLSILPIYYTYRVLTASSAYSLADASANPLNAIKLNRRTIRSSFGVQFWEGLPYFLFGMLFFAMLFGDRVMSWFFNPDHLVDGIRLPLVFNITYHLGADVALFVIFPASIIQFVIMSPISEQLSNLVTRTKAREIEKVDTFLRYRYGLAVTVSAAVAAGTAFALIIFSHGIEALIGGSSTSIFVLQVAAVANVFMVIFMANSLFLIFMNKIKALLGITAVGVLVLAQVGILMSRLGFQDVVFGYLFATIVTMALSYQWVVWSLNRPGSLFFSRYI